MRSIKIVHLFPDLLNLYGERGNVTCLQRRCAWRGIPVEVVQVTSGQSLDLTDVDIVFLGGGADREQELAYRQLMGMKDALKGFVEAQGVLLAICGGFQLLGKECLVAEKQVEGLGLVDMVTKAAGGKAGRFVSDVVVQTELSSKPVIGYENHAGATFLGNGTQPFGKVVSSVGHGNNEADKVDGARYKNLIGSYLHGPLLAKSPQVADYLLQKALDVRQAHGEAPVSLLALDDTIEDEANAYMAQRLKV